MNETADTAPVELAEDAPVLETVDAVIDALGGTKAASVILDTTPSRISNWRSWGMFPDKASVLMAVRDACATRGFRVNEQLFRERVA